MPCGNAYTPPWKRWKIKTDSKYTWITRPLTTHSSPLTPHHSLLTTHTVPSETLKFSSPRLLSQLYVDDTHNLNQIERLLAVNLVTRDDWIQVEGTPEGIAQVKDLFLYLQSARDQGIHIQASDFHYTLRCIAGGKTDELHKIYENPLVVKLKRRSIIPKTLNQKRYLQSIAQNTITFGIGPAGTGKTYLAVAMGLKELLAGTVERILLTRPAVEAGEALGFLPGELKEKVLPYLTPLYDAMNDMMGKELVARMVEDGAIEIAPLAYMRGRTLDHAFVILDEAQNATESQFKMFVTRMGKNAKFIVTGDITQIDLPNQDKSGLKQALKLLKGVEGIDIIKFGESDVMRHPIVKKIIKAYGNNK